jgi:hypothetical protein
MTTIVCTQTGEIASPTGPRIEAVIAATDAGLEQIPLNPICIRRERRSSRIGQV